jgi:cobalt-zinc-cadmium efflux system membrane fusion protein
MKVNILNKGKFAVFVLAVLLAAACGNKSSETSNKEEKPQAASQNKEDATTVDISEEQYKTVGITIGSTEKRGLSGLLKVNGFIDVPPQNLVSVSTQMGGIVKATPLLQGSLVKKGQVVAVLQNQDYVQLQQDYLDSRSQLELSDAEYKRQQTLASQNINAQKVLQQSKAQYQGNLARSSALKERLKLININPESLNASNIRSSVNVYAPISGYVTKVNVNIGKFVNPNDVMFELVNSSNLHVELNVFQKDAERVKSGQKVRFTLANDTIERRAVVQLVGREVGADKTVTVHSTARGSFKFTPGTYLKALIETGTNDVSTLPESAVVDFQGKKYVFIEGSTQKKANPTGKTAGSEKSDQQVLYHFRLVSISTGLSEGGYTEVRLPENSNAEGKIVTKGAYDLLSKMKNSEEE